jgi:RND family efflux transporter MFP subunit
MEQDRSRIDQLVEEGAVAQSDLDQAKSEVDSAQADVTVQEQRLSLLKAGPRPGEVKVAQAALAEARASRDTSVRAAQERLNTLLSLPRREDIEAARARVDEARAQLAQSEEARSKSDLRAPFEGVVAGIPVEQGQSVSPGQTLVVLHEMSKPIIEVETDEENLSVLSTGQRAVVSSDAYPGRTFQAVLYDLGSQVNPERGTITIKLRPLEQVDWVRPDLTVDVNIVTRRNVRRTVLPPDTVTKSGGRSVVLLIRDGVTVPLPVRTGAAGPAGVAVFGDLKDGDRVARDASEVGPNVDVVATRER